MDVLLLGGPEDGAIKQLEPDLEDGYTLVDVMSDIRHNYLYYEIDPIGSSKIWGVCVHDSLISPSHEETIDRILATVVELYVQQAKSKETK